ncbi:MAG: ABC-type glutathione transport system ATPase component, partial [Myxococcota bacterium]
MADPLLVVEDLAVGYVRTDGSVIRAVEGVSFTLNRGETLGLCGESGCGKSTLVYGLLRTLAAPGAVLGGSVTLDGHDLLALDDEGLRKLRWKTSAIVPQSALNALNPVLTIRAHVRDTLVAHGEFSRDIAEQRGAELLRMVDIDPVHLGSYPHELSGGMRQRVALALALLFEPPLLVMDEPTTALDVVVERGILRRVQELQERLGFAMLF